MRQAKDAAGDRAGDRAGDAAGTGGIRTSCYFVALDTETGGLRPAWDAITDIAAVLCRVDRSGDVLGIDDQALPPLSLAVEPGLGMVVTDQALVARGITREELHARPGQLCETDAAAALVEYLNVCNGIASPAGRLSRQGLEIVAHNCAFDQQFVDALLERTGILRSLRLPYLHWRDTADLERVLMQAGLLAQGSASLAECYRRRLWDLEGHHGALADARSCARLYRSQLQLMRGGS